MSSTSSVLQEFVSMHGDVVKECKLDQLVAQYQELHDNVSDAAADLGLINGALMREDDDEFSDENIAAALEAFLAEDEDSSFAAANVAHGVVAPSDNKMIITAPVSVVAAAPHSAPDISSMTLPAPPSAAPSLVAAVGQPVTLAQLYAE